MPVSRRLSGTGRTGGGGAERGDSRARGPGAPRPAGALRQAGIYANAHMTPRDIRAFCRVSDGADALLRTAINRLGLLARGYHRMLKIARTVDLDGKPELEPTHVSEAIQYRSLDRRGVG